MNMSLNKNKDKSVGREPEQELTTLADQGLLRSLRPLPECGGVINIDGRQVLNFSSNDYLNLATDSRLKAASIKSINQYGCGSTASRLMSGHLELHETLENDLAAMTGMEEALVFGSGFLTNLGVLSTLAQKGDMIFCDRLNHASLIDGMRLSGAKWFRYKHKNLNSLEKLLKENTDKSGQRIIVSDSIFSMDGDIANLKGLAELAESYNATLMIDEAHALGIMGECGGGISRLKDAHIKPDIIVATMSKALGSYGGFVACSDTMRKLLINRARSFIYSTALPPACLGAGRKAISIIQSEKNLGGTLLNKARFMHDILCEKGFHLPDFESQILPLHIGENQKALEMAQALWKKDIIATAVRPPTVPEGTARLRLSVTLAHSEDNMRHAAKCIAETAQELGVI